MASPLDALLPVRRILVDNEALPFARELNLDSSTLTATTSDGRVSLSARDLSVVIVASGGTLTAHAVNLLDDDEEDEPVFVLPAPSTWSGKRLIAKRVAQPASSVVLSVSGGATIDGESSYEMHGSSTCAEFFSDGTNVYVGPSAYEAPIAWTPARITGAIFWALGIADSSLRDMTSSRVDVMRNGIDNGITLERNGTNPTISTAFLHNGHPRLILGSTNELISLSGGPTGTQAHWMIALTDARDLSVHGSLMRCGAKGNSCSALGILTNPLYSAGTTSDFVPWGNSGTSLPVSGELRVIGAHHIPQYAGTATRILRVDGITPTASTYYHNKTVAMTAEFGFGRSITAHSANGSGILDAVWGIGEISASDYAQLIEYWRVKFSFPRLAPRLLAIGDSITFGYESGGVTSWPHKTLALVNAQLTLDGRTNAVLSNIAASAKRIDGAWDALNPPMTFQSSGGYETFVTSGTRAISESAPYSRSGRRAYEIALTMGGHNDIVSDGASAAQVIERLKRVNGDLMDHGYYVVGVACPGGDTVTFWTAPREAIRVAVRDWMLASGVSGGYMHRAVSTDGIGLTLPTHYMVDQFHLNDAGETVVAAAVAPVVNGLITEIHGRLAA